METVLKIPTVFLHLNYFQWTFFFSEVMYTTNTHLSGTNIRTFLNIPLNLLFPKTQHVNTLPRTSRSPTHQPSLTYCQTMHIEVPSKGQKQDIYQIVLEAGNSWCILVWEAGQRKQLGSWTIEIRKKREEKKKKDITMPC